MTDTLLQRYGIPCGHERDGHGCLVDDGVHEWKVRSPCPGIILPPDLEAKLLSVVDAASLDSYPTQEPDEAWREVPAYQLLALRTTLASLPPRTDTKEEAP